MAKVELKTRANDASVEQYLNKVEDKEKRTDCFRILELMQEVTGEEPAMWGPAIIGFGTIRLKYDSGRELDWILTGFSPRKANITLYITDCFDRYGALMERLGKYKTGKSCLYIKKLTDIDTGVLQELITLSVENVKSGRVFSHPE